MPTDELRIPFAKAIVKDVCSLLGCSLRGPWVGQADKIANECLRDMDHRQQTPTFVEGRIVSIARAALSTLGITVYNDSLLQQVCDCVAPHAEAYSALISERTRVATALRTAAQTGADDKNTRKTIECAWAIVRGVYQALPNERAVRVQSSAFEPAVAEVISLLRGDRLAPPGRSLGRRYLTRTICLAVLAKILPDGGPQYRDLGAPDFSAAVFNAVAAHLPKYPPAEVTPSEPKPVTRLEAKTLKAREVRLRNEAAQIGEAPTDLPPAPVAARPECPCCRSEKITYNATADVWHCPNCSWSKRQLVAPPPGPKFQVGDWVVSNRSTRDPAQRSTPSQVMGFLWSENEWCCVLHREGPGGMSTSGANGTKESFLILDPHRQAAAKMFGKPVAHVTSERQAAKLKAFKDAYTVIPGADFYQVRPEDRVRMLGKPPSWGTAW